MSMTEILKNNKIARCDSCGNVNSCKKYNNANLCIACLRMDSGGVPRNSNGRILPSNISELHSGFTSKPRKRKL